MTASRLRPAPRADAAHGRALPSPRHQSGPDLEARRDVLRDERADPRRPDGLRALLAALPDPGQSALRARVQDLLAERSRQSREFLLLADQSSGVAQPGPP